MYNSSDISLVIPSFNETDSIERCVRSVINQQKVFPGEVIFIDNNSTDETVTLINSIRKELPVPSQVFIENKKGIPFVRNLGINKSSGKIITFLDADCEAPSDYFSSILLDFNENDISAVTGRYILIGKDMEKAKFREQAWSNHFGWNGKNKKIHSQMFQQIGTLVSGCSSFKKTVLEKIGLYDTRFIYMDDIALSEKFYRLGFRSLQDSNIAVVHHIETAESVLFRKDKHYGEDRARINRYQDRKFIKFYFDHYKTIIKDIIKLLFTFNKFYLYEMRTVSYYKIGLFYRGLILGCLYI